MEKRFLLVMLGLSLTITGCASQSVTFEKTRIGNATYEAASVFDVDEDGRLDIVSGEYWFEGPDFTSQHKICTITPNEDYFNDFADIPLDVDGDGYTDIVSGGWWESTLLWRHNPQGRRVEWTVHNIDKCGNIETIRPWDIDGDGIPEMIPNLPGNPLFAYQLVTGDSGKGTGRFIKHLIFNQNQGHGLGFGDINADGRPDFVLTGGWLEAPENPFGGEWKWHPEFDLGPASIPILVYDVDRDGNTDLIVGQGHAYGLFWMQQKTIDGKRAWIKHDIDPGRSQYHDLQLHDIDNDGRPELITGKRYRAHVGRDPGANDPIGLYYFEIDNNKFRRVTIDYGDPKIASGAGIYFWVQDIDGDGWKDIVAPGKEGLYLFTNKGR